MTLNCTFCDRHDGIHANILVDEYLHDCLYTDRDWLSFTLQILSLVAWLCAQVPQFIDNWRRQSSDALSPWFLAEWFLGDACNLIGCLLTGVQLPLTTGTAWYFITCDIIMIMQYVYFTGKSRRRQLRADAIAKREAIRAGARAARQTLREQDLLQEKHHPTDQDRTSCKAPQLLPHVHSAPGIAGSIDVSWDVHTRPSVLPQGEEASGIQAPHDSYNSAEERLDIAQPSDFVVRPRLAPSITGTPDPSQPAALLSNAAATATSMTLGLVVLALLASSYSSDILTHAEVRVAGSQQLIHRDAGAALGIGDTIMLGTDSLSVRQRLLLSEDYSHEGADGFRERAVHSSSLGKQLVDYHLPEGVLESEPDLPRCPILQAPQWAQQSGLILGFISAGFYLKSRISQIIKNYQRKSTDGLAMSMFLCAILGNLTGFLGIVLRLENVSAFFFQLPWMIGMFGTVALDVTIAWQFSAYGTQPSVPHLETILEDESQEPLLSTLSDSSTSDFIYHESSVQ